MKRKVGNQKMGVCVDCASDVLWRESYIVRNKVWEQAGMAWDGGFLHLTCLEKRLGRKLTVKDFLARFKGHKPNGTMIMECLDPTTFKAEHDERQKQENGRSRAC